MSPLTNLSFFRIPYFTAVGLALLALVVTPGAFAAAGKKQLKVGFAQTGAESAWRTANSESIKSEAAKRGIDLKFSDGQGKQENQIRAVRSFITQGVDAIVIAPIVATGWDPPGIARARRTTITRAFLSGT